MEGAFGRLASMQIASGHFSMWGDDGYINPGLTPCIAEFLLDAKDAGFAVPDNVLQKALNRLSEDLLSGGNEFYGQDRLDNLKFANQAWSGYVLARVNRAPLGTLRALYDNQRDKALTGLSLVHLGIALSLQGDTKRGDAAIKAGFAKDSSERPPYFGDYGSAIRDDALMMALLHERGLSKPEYDTRAVALGRALDARRATGWLWLSTQEQVALARLGKALMVGQGKQVSGSLTMGDQVQQVAPARVFGRSFDSAALARGVQFAPQGEAPMYASLEVAGIPRSAPEPDTRNLSVERSWYTTDGKPCSPTCCRQVWKSRISISAMPSSGRTWWWTASASASGPAPPTSSTKSSATTAMWPRWRCRRAARRRCTTWRVQSHRAPTQCRRRWWKTCTGQSCVVWAAARQPR